MSAWNLSNRMKMTYVIPMLQLQPLSYIVWMLNWALSNVIWLMIETNIWQYVGAASRPTGKPTSCSSVVALKNVTTCTTCRREWLYPVFNTVSIIYFQNNIFFSRLNLQSRASQHKSVLIAAQHRSGMKIFVKLERCLLTLRGKV